MTIDYFGALLRSAGRPVARPAVLPAPTSGGADLVEIDVEQEVRQQFAQEAGQTGGISTVAQPRQDTGAPDRKAGPVAMHTSSPPSRQPDAHLPVPAPPAHGEPAAAPDVLDLSPPPAHTALQAAMAWVAADPHGRTEPGLPADSERGDAVVRLAVSGIEEVTQDIEVLPPSRIGIEDTGIGAIDDAPGHDAVQFPMAGRRLAPMPVAARRARAATAPREERVDVTIGAIHLRVDAPPPAAVAPAPATPAAAPSLRSPTPRSTLSRRALYRL
ncbi:hypothetical protein [Variovorax paradoxus]|uniref:Uncharacterized protein n=1 Tax=Variovorax paradoxus TaxID=34073 RepID=A0A679J7D5_VARPD|nr:hypothetical protein VVAX_01848 [Variovorax paradoxus]